jgi:hypothetical protein
MARDSLPRRQILLNFVKANYAVAMFVVGAVAIEAVRTWLVAHIYFSSISLLIVEVAVLACLTLMYRGRREIETNDLFPENVVKRERLEVRFATTKDFVETEAIYHEWFKPALSIDDEEYLKIMDRGSFIRLAEATIGTETHAYKTIIGFYDIWPISGATYDGLARGNIREKDLTSDDVLDVSDPLASTLYIPEICVSKGWDVGPQLLRDLMRYIDHIVQQNCNIVRVAAWPYTKEGKRLIEGSKMTRARWRPFKAPIHQVPIAIVRRLPKPTGQFKSKWSTKY